MGDEPQSENATKSLRGKVAIVTGAAQGIGRCIAEFLQAAGASVMLADVQVTNLRATTASLSAGGNVDSFGVDISDVNAVQQMVERTNERFGRLDILVCCAGIDAPPGMAWEISEDDWRRVVDVDLSAQWWCAQSALPTMMQQGGGRIIFISSRAARVGTKDISVAYNAAKAGLIGLTVGLAAHVETHGIRVNAIAAGPTGTGNVTPEERSLDRQLFPLGLGGAEPVAHACLYLAGPSGDWISGAVLNVSGGSWRG